MKKTAILLLALATVAFSACSTDYYEPVFGFDNLPTVIPAAGGTYMVQYDYAYYATKADVKYFDWQYRIIVDGEIVTVADVKHMRGDSFPVQIAPNRNSYPKSILVEASTHVRTYEEDWWGDWTPVASSVQLSY
ncbi:MAG: hypothetical protein J6P69_08635 [Bacteroidales bacterium]|nr:hypothetical protein [Bacteroidales bacterium]